MTKEVLKPIDVSKYKVTEAGQVLKVKDELEKRCANYETRISQMEKGTCDACKETEKDKRLEELEVQVEDLKSDHEYNLELMKGLNERITELKEDLRNKKLAIQNRNSRIEELEAANAELKEHHTSVCESLTNTHRNLREQLTEAKAVIRVLLRVTYGEGWNYSLDVKAMAEQFLKEV